MIIDIMFISRFCSGKRARRGLSHADPDYSGTDHACHSKTPEKQTILPQPEGVYGAKSRVGNGLCLRSDLPHPHQAMNGGKTRLPEFPFDLKEHLCLFAWRKVVDAG